MCPADSGAGVRPKRLETTRRGYLPTPPLPVSIIVAPINIGNIRNSRPVPDNSRRRAAVW